MDVIFCCCCSEEIGFGYEQLVSVQFLDPGSEPIDYMALVCTQCAKDHEFDKLKPVVEAIISARIARIASPDKRYTP